MPQSQKVWDGSFIFSTFWKDKVRHQVVNEAAEVEEVAADYKNIKFIVFE